MSRDGRSYIIRLPHNMFIRYNAVNFYRIIYVDRNVECTSLPAPKSCDTTALEMRHQVLERT